MKDTALVESFKAQRDKIIELQTEIASERARNAELVAALEFYDNAHRKQWTINLNDLAVVAYKALEKNRREV